MGASFSCPLSPGSQKVESRPSVPITSTSHCCPVADGAGEDDGGPGSKFKRTTNDQLARLQIAAMPLYAAVIVVSSASR